MTDRDEIIVIVQREEGPLKPIRCFISGQEVQRLCGVKFEQFGDYPCMLGKPSTFEILTYKHDWTGIDNRILFKVRSADQIAPENNGGFCYRVTCYPVELEVQK